LSHDTDRRDHYGPPVEIELIDQAGGWKRTLVLLFRAACAQGADAAFSTSPPML
jgi:hypothetical protein